MEMNQSQEKTGADLHRIFPAPEGIDLQQLVGDLERWLSRHEGVAAEVRGTGDDWGLTVRETGGRLRRLVHRQAGSLRLRLTRKADGVAVDLYFGDRRSIPNAGGSGGFLRNAAASAKGAAGSLADAAASKITDLWVSDDRADAIFTYIGDRIVEAFRSASGGRTIGIDEGRSRYVEPRSAVEGAWIEGYRAPDERLLAWLGTSTEVPGFPDAQWRYLLTDRRAALVGFTQERFIALKELPTAPMAVTDVIGRDTVTVADASWRTRLTNDTLFREIAPFSPLEPPERIHGAAQANIRNGDTAPDPLQYGRDLLAHLETISADPLHRLSRIYADRPAAAGLSSDHPARWAPAAEALTNVSGERLRHWADAWGLTAWERILLAGLLQDATPGSRKKAEGLHPLLAAARERLQAETREEARRLLADLRYARNLGDMRRGAEAAALLEADLPTLPDETLADLLPAPDADLTRGEGGQLMRVRILELLVDLRGAPESADPETLRTLAVLQPLVPERLERLKNASSGEIRRRAAAALDLLEPGGPGAASGPSRPPGEEATPLPSAHIREMIRHPAAREGTVVHKLQGLIAARKVPDRSALKSFAKRVTPQSHPEISSAIADGTILLRMAAVEAYIAFGDLDIGVRGYEGKPDFILIGGAHLEEDASHAMSPGELRFAIGAELAHIKFKHERITSREIWEGAIDKAMSVMELMPLVGTYLGKLGRLGRMAGRATEVAKRVGTVKEYISQGRNMIADNQHLFRRRPPAAEGRTEEEDLIGAFRVMQLTADRAGLVVGGDLAAAVGSIFKSGPHTAAGMPTADRYGLHAFLSRTDDRGVLLHQDLAIRLAALFSFYLSREFEILMEEGYLHRSGEKIQH